MNIEAHAQQETENYSSVLQQPENWFLWVRENLSDLKFVKNLHEERLLKLENH